MVSAFSLQYGRCLGWSRCDGLGWNRCERHLEFCDVIEYSYSCHERPGCDIDIPDNVQRQVVGPDDDGKEYKVCRQLEEI